MALLRLQRGHLRGLDLSQLVLREAYLQGVEMQDANLRGAALPETRLTEAMSAIWSVAISCTGKFWAAGSWRGDVRVWCKGGQRLYLFWQAHTENIFTLALSPDERTLVSGSLDGTVKLWDLQSGTLLWTAWHPGPIYSVAFAPDGRKLASASGSEFLVREVQSGKCLQSVEVDCDLVAAVAWDQSGDILVSGGSDGRLCWWEVQSGACLREHQGHEGTIWVLKRSPDGRWLARSGDDGAIRIWDLPSGELVQTLRRDRPDRTKVGGCFALWKRTRHILALAFDDSMRADLVVCTINRLDFCVPGTIWHSDQGSQYGAEQTRAALLEKGFICSMSRAGTPTDNGYAERFVGIFKQAVAERRRYQTLGCFLEASENWINFSNHLRPHEGLGQCSPDQFACTQGLPPAPSLPFL